MIFTLPCLLSKKVHSIINTYLLCWLLHTYQRITVYGPNSCSLFYSYFEHFIFQLCGRLFSNLTEYVNRTLYKLTALFLATEFVWYKVLLKLFQIL